MQIFAIPFFFCFEQPLN
uniref:Uncharacterized protein n=1 Tax=Rhizophora mucronata TaxID=61149 RepID=A0A2P2P6S9_RHIMU